MSAGSRPAPSVMPAPAFPRTLQPSRPGARTVRAPSRGAGEGWSTPRLLQAFLLASLLLAVALFVAGYAAYRTMQQSVQSVGRDSIPSILAAQQIRTSLVDMDASAANDILAGSGGSRTARDSYDADRSLIGRQVITASQNITYGTLERIPIETLQDGMTDYTGLIATAQQQLRDNPNSRDAALGPYMQASNELHTVLVPAAQRLDEINTAYLNQAYGNVDRATAMVSAFVLLAGLALFAALVWAQVFLMRHTRRVFNLPLLAASIALVLFLINAVTTVGAVRADLRTAKVDAFDSVSALSQARAHLSDANGVQAKALLDPTNAARYRMQFTQLTQGTDTTEGIVNGQVTPDMIQEARAVASAHVQDPRSSRTVSFKGYLADEINNITFGKPEADAAIAALTEFANYQQTDQQITNLVGQGKTADALALATGTNTDQAHRAFERLDIALVRTINVNRTAFDTGIGRGFAHIAPLQWLSPVTALVIGLLAFLGLQPRLREYAV